MAEIKEDFGAGGRNLQPGHGDPAVADALRDVADDLDGNKNVPTWLTEVAVSGDAATLAQAGAVLAVKATAGSTDAMDVVRDAPSAGQVQVTYDADGIATLTFAGADGVTECDVHLMPHTALKTTKG